MDNAAPAIPGFRSLSQAGIQLGDGRELSPSPEAQAGGSKSVELTPAATASKVRRAQSVVVQPREPGTKRPLPHQQQKHQEMVPQGSVPNGLYLGELPSLQFSCPSCGVVLTITEAESAFFQIEKRGAERISFEQFKHWWLNAELDADQNANFAISV